MSTDIGIPEIRAALDKSVFAHPRHVEDPEPPCAWPRLCGPTFCRFPHYLRDNQPTGLTATVLIHLGYNTDLLKALDCEYEMGELLHPGIKIHRSRNKALSRVTPEGRQLLAFLQARQKTHMTWTRISVEAFRARHLIPLRDNRRRPWLY